MILRTMSADVHPDSPGADLLTTADVAELLGVTVATVNRWAAAGALEAAAMAGGRVFRRSVVVAFAADRADEAERVAARLREAAS